MDVLRDGADTESQQSRELCPGPTLTEAVFLRVLEYYAGILFLATNRIGDFDEAFASRIHISLYYPPLGRDPTEEIFALNLKLIREQVERRGLKIDVDEEGILKFAAKYWSKHEKMRWNGRQIRNACQTALALAEYDALDAKTAVRREVDTTAKVHLTVGHLKIVSKPYLEFLKYLKDVHGRDAERRAKYMGIRAREPMLVENKTKVQEEEEDSDDENQVEKQKGKQKEVKPAPLQETANLTPTPYQQPFPSPQPPQASSTASQGPTNSHFGIPPQISGGGGAYNHFAYPQASPGFGQSQQAPVRGACQQAADPRQQQTFANPAAWQNMMMSAGSQNMGHPPNMFTGMMQPQQQPYPGPGGGGMGGAQGPDAGSSGGVGGQR
jgi:hypothetical protein